MKALFGLVSQCVLSPRTNYVKSANIIVPQIVSLYQLFCLVMADSCSGIWAHSLLIKQSSLTQGSPEWQIKETDHLDLARCEAPSAALILITFQP